MKMSVRQGVFETNSSSMHAIVIDTSGNLDDVKDTYYYHYKYGSEPVEETDYARVFILDIEPVDITRSYDILTDIESRVNYLWTAICFVDYCTDPNKHMYGYDSTVDRSSFVSDLHKWKLLINDVLKETYPGFKYDFEFRDLASTYYSTAKFDDVFYLIPLIKELYNNRELLRAYLCGKDSYAIPAGPYYRDEFIHKLARIVDGDEILKAYYHTREVLNTVYDETKDSGEIDGTYLNKGYYQCMINHSDDLLYKVDDEDKIIFIKESA